MCFQNTYGTKHQISFNDEHEYYQCLRYLARNRNNTSIHWEHNEEQGAWGSEGRIHFYIQNPRIPGNFELTSGVGNIIHRTNCNEFVIHIIKEHNFVIGSIQDINNILYTIPEIYQTDFFIGLNIID